MAVLPYRGLETLETGATGWPSILNDNFTKLDMFGINSGHISSATVPADNTYDALKTDSVIVMDCTNASMTLNLPTGDSANGHVYYIMRLGTDKTKTLTITVPGVENINGLSSIVLSYDFETVVVVSGWGACGRWIAMTGMHKYTIGGASGELREVLQTGSPATPVPTKLTYQVKQSLTGESASWTTVFTYPMTVNKSFALFDIKFTVLLSDGSFEAYDAGTIQNTGYRNGAGAVNIGISPYSKVHNGFAPTDPFGIQLVPSGTDILLQCRVNDTVNTLTGTTIFLFTIDVYPQAA